MKLMGRHAGFITAGAVVVGQHVNFALILEVPFAWGHLNLLGEYDFSEDKLQDSVGIKPPKLPTKPGPVLGVPESPKILYASTVGRNPMGLYVPLLG